jgi:hypothetical protein
MKEKTKIDLQIYLGEIIKKKQAIECLLDTPISLNKLTYNELYNK